MIRTIAPAQLVVEPAVEGVVVPLVRRLALGLRQRLLGLQRVVDDDDVGAAPGQDAADRGGEPAALRRRVEFRHRGALRREAGREDLPVPVAGDDMPAIARQFVGEVLRVADAEDLRRGSCPRHQAGKAIEASSDFRWRGGRLMTSRRILPSRNAVSFAAMISICQLIAKRVRGLSSLKQPCAKLTRSRRNSARYSSGVGLSDGSFTTETRRARRRCLLRF